MSRVTGANHSWLFFCKEQQEQFTQSFFFFWRVTRANCSQWLCNVMWVILSKRVHSERAKSKRVKSERAKERKSKERREKSVIAKSERAKSKREKSKRATMRIPNPEIFQGIETSNWNNICSIACLKAKTEEELKKGIFPLCASKTQGWASVLFKRTHVLAFFCVLYKKNVAFFAFFHVIYKRTLRSLRSL